MKFVRVSVLALMLSVGIVTAPVVMTGCAQMGIFQSDPVGASLLTMKSAYESAVKTAGRLYVQKFITEAQLRKFRDEANKFYAGYMKVVTLHEEGKITSKDDSQLKNLESALTALETLVASYSK